MKMKKMKKMNMKMKKMMIKDEYDDEGSGGED